MANVISENIECCGCSACQSICSKNAIILKKNKFGFYSPVIDDSKCVNCGLCLKKCPIYNKTNERLPLNAYACKHKDDSKRMKSTSGGVFIGLAEAIIRQGGVCFGAAYDQDYMGVHHTSTDEVKISDLQKSKYVQSYLGNTFQSIIKEASKGRKVLFVGTPCQCAGLRRVLKDADNVFLVDFICGGTPSTKCYKQYLNQLSNNQNAKIIELDFRSKRCGWKKQYLDITFSNGKIMHRAYYRDPYYALFCIKHITTNFICEQCPFRQRHESDITIADYWGYKKANMEYDDKGLSLVAVNTRQGMNLFNEFSEKEIKKLSFNEYGYAFNEFKFSNDHLQIKKNFFNELLLHDFNEIYSEYVKTDIYSVIIMRIKNAILKFIR